MDSRPSSTPDTRTAGTVRLSLLSLLLAGIVAGQSQLLVQFEDPKDDSAGRIDVIRLVLRFDSATGDYEVQLLATAEKPFNGEFRVNLNLFNPDSVTDAYTGALPINARDFRLAAPAASLTIRGNDAGLKLWRLRHRVSTSTPPFGNPRGTTMFRSSIMDMPFQCGIQSPHPGVACEEDVIAYAAAGMVDSGGPLVRLSKVWSEQLHNGAEVNFLPPGENGAGAGWINGNPRAYILMGADENDRAELSALFVTSSGAPRERLRVDLAVLEANGGTRTVAEGVLDHESKRAALRLDWSESIGALTDFAVISGLDDDGNGKLEGSEILDRVNLRVVFKVSYAAALLALKDAVFKGQFDGGRGFARAFVDRFLLAAADLSSLGAAEQTSSVSVLDRQLSHHVGVRFQPAGDGPVKRYVFPPDSELASEVLQSGSLRAALEESARSFQSSLRSACFEDGRSLEIPIRLVSNSEQCKDLGVRVEPGIPLVNFHCGAGDRNLALAFGAALVAPLGSAANPGFLAKVGLDGGDVRITAAEMAARLEDVYDFDYDWRGVNKDPELWSVYGASLQAGFPTLGEVGEVFRTSVDLRGTVPLDARLGRPDRLLVLASREPFTVKVQRGGFDPASQRKIYGIANQGTQPLDYTVTADAPWLQVSPASGRLAAGGTASVTVALADAARNLPEGSHAASVVFTRAGCGKMEPVRVVLEISAGPPVSTCANIAGQWVASEKGTLTCTVTVNGESETATDPINGGDIVTIAQQGCQVSYTSPSITAAFGPGRTLRQGQVEGTTVTFSGIMGEIASGFKYEKNLLESSGTIQNDGINLTGTGTLVGSGVWQGMNVKFSCTAKTTATLKKWTGPQF